MINKKVLVEKCKMYGLPYSNKTIAELKGAIDAYESENGGSQIHATADDNSEVQDSFADDSALGSVEDGGETGASKPVIEKNAKSEQIVDIKKSAPTALPKSIAKPEGKFYIGKDPVTKEKLYK